MTANETPVAAIRAVADRLNAAAGGTLYGTVARGCTWTACSPASPTPLGGAVIGRACDLYGRINGQTGLYAIDSSLVPRSASAANPELTVTALAERNIERIIREDLR